MPFVIPRVLQPPFTFIDIFSDEDTVQINPSITITNSLTTLRDTKSFTLVPGDRFIVNWYVDIDKGGVAGNTNIQLQSIGQPVQFGGLTSQLDTRVFNIPANNGYWFTGTAIGIAAGTGAGFFRLRAQSFGSNSETVGNFNYLQVWQIQGSN